MSTWSSIDKKLSKTEDEIQKMTVEAKELLAKVKEMGGVTPPKADEGMFSAFVTSMDELVDDLTI